MWSRYHQLHVCFLFSSGLIRWCRFRDHDSWLWFVWPLALRRSHRLSRGSFTAAAGGLVVLNTGLIWVYPPLTAGSSGPSLLSYCLCRADKVGRGGERRNQNIYLSISLQAKSCYLLQTHTHTQDKTCLLTCYNWSWFPSYLWHNIKKKNGQEDHWNLKHFQY